MHTSSVLCASYWLCVGCAVVVVAVVMVLVLVVLVFRLWESVVFVVSCIHYLVDIYRHMWVDRFSIRLGLYCTVGSSIMLCAQLCRSFRWMY